MLVKVVVQLLVGDVDAELFKAVDWKVLKAKDVEYADGARHLRKQ